MNDNFAQPGAYRQFCSVCQRGPLFSWERVSDGRCTKCASATLIELEIADLATAIRQFICATRPELAKGFVIDVHAMCHQRPVAVAFQPRTLTDAELLAAIDAALTARTRLPDPQ